ncbi:MAG: DUF559 domain-containing protein [Chloroflexi bacterium]|nr:MAG: DUF559 domain-containing protein [Chloroflexota bacterium]
MPNELRSGPFRLQDARRAGLTWKQLQSRSFHRLGHDSYAWSVLDADPMLRLRAAIDRLPPEAVFSQRTAAWLHGLDVPPCDPIQVTVPKECGSSYRSGLAVRRAPVPAADVVERKGMPATTILRTLLEIAEARSPIEPVVVFDMALRAALVTPHQLAALAADRAGLKYAKRLRRVVDLADHRSESPMESRLRTILVLSGVPRPELQVDLFDQLGNHLGRADLYYPDQRLVIEFDGATHRHSLVEDNRRQNRILAAGYRLLRFTAADLRNQAAVAAQVRAEIQR